MAGVVYMKSNSSVSLTGAEYTDISIPSGCKTLYIQTGNATSDRIKYGLTTDPTATSYSPVINVSGTTMMIARQSTISETVTTGTRYHTATRKSTSATDTVFDNTITSTASRNSTGQKGNETITYFSGPRLYSWTMQWKGYNSVFSSESRGQSQMVSGRECYGPVMGYTSNLTTIQEENWNYFTTTTSLTYRYLFRTVGGTATSYFTYRYRTAFTKSKYYYTKTALVYGTGIQYTNFDDAVRTVTLTTGTHTVESYLTRSSTYTSRTEYLTSGNTYTTNNIAA